MRENVWNHMSGEIHSSERGHNLFGSINFQGVGAPIIWSKCYSIVIGWISFMVKGENKRGCRIYCGIIRYGLVSRQRPRCSQQQRRAGKPYACGLVFSFSGEHFLAHLVQKWPFLLLGSLFQQNAAVYYGFRTFFFGKMMGYSCIDRQGGSSK